MMRLIVENSRLFPTILILYILLMGNAAQLRADESSHLVAKKSSNTYVVRGVIRKLPDGPRSSELLIRHEAIPNYVDESGQEVGMPAMTMPFQVANDLSLAGLAVGDQVEFLWESSWHPKPLDFIKSIKKIS